MQSMCLKEAGANATDPLVGETNHLQLIFGGYLRSKHNPQAENSRQQHSLGLFQPFSSRFKPNSSSNSTTNTSSTELTAHDMYQTTLEVVPKEEIFVPLIRTQRPHLCSGSWRTW
ncbi:uncharacterized protein LOC131220585 [Magnolia sinica]|uniref:uncharacterized protein LOC131220585 n=1 Tax=Magnolia sinica TaxID=86752 RepID=UPI0026598B8E|nr:uncharacterized protein LOC131220585 [Magnolia sinica]